MRVRCGPERRNGGTDLEGPGMVSECGEIPAEALDTVGVVSRHSLDRRNTVGNTCTLATCAHDISRNKSCEVTSTAGHPRRAKRGTPRV